METKFSASIHFKPEFKKSATTFLSKFGKFPPEFVTIAVAKDKVVLKSHTPGTSVVLNCHHLLDSLNGKPFEFSVSRETLSTMSGCSVETATLNLMDTFIQITSGRMKLELPIEEPVAHEYREPVENPLSVEFQEHLKYSLPIMKKTSSTLARSELFLECANDNFKTFNIAAVVGTKIHLIESYTECESVYKNSGDGISVIAPFDLLEGLQSADDANMLVDKNTLVVTESDCTSSAQTREHSLGVDYNIILEKAKTPDPGSIVFNIKTERLLKMMTDLPKPPNNSEYTLVFTVETGVMSLAYKGKGVRFSDSLKIVNKEPLDDKKEFGVEYGDLLPVVQAVADISEKCTAILSESRLMFRVKTDIGYSHFIALSRVM